jgi:hypothetical protein
MRDGAGPKSISRVLGPRRRGDATRAWNAAHNSQIFDGYFAFSAESDVSIDSPTMTRESHSSPFVP